MEAADALLLERTPEYDAYQFLLWEFLCLLKIIVGGSDFFMLCSKKHFQPNAQVSLFTTPLQINRTFHTLLQCPEATAQQQLETDQEVRKHREGDDVRKLPEMQYH